MSEALDRIVWTSLSGAQAPFAVGDERVKRFANGFAALVGFADESLPDLAPLTAVSQPGELIYCLGVSASMPGWRRVFETKLMRMVWAGELPAADDFVEARRLTSVDAQQAFDLAALTRPGPFGMRSLELGEYFGVYVDDRLIAMAGERLFAPPYREISGVCTHPDFQGRGLGRRLVAKLVRREMLRGETPFLHVVHDNTNAFALYERMGFRTQRQVAMYVLRRET